MEKAAQEVLEEIRAGKETVWINPAQQVVNEREKVGKYGFIHMKAAQTRLMRFMPYFEKYFPETAQRKGIIESDLKRISNVQNRLKGQGVSVEGTVYLKADHELPIAGSVKARGGIHAVLRYAEALALEQGLIEPTETREHMAAPKVRELFGTHTIQVATTGNLGISVGTVAARLGFRVIVHMSKDASEWKKQLLRKKGVIVKEYGTDYSQAIVRGREEAAQDPNSYFIDDEDSLDLFMGYATAAMRLKVQLYKAGIEVDEQHPLFVYLPCGVGGAPGGITFGLKQMFGEAVHCFFVEPTQAPCMLLGMLKNEKASVLEEGLSGVTIADGLAVQRPSMLVKEMMDPLLAGEYTVSDGHLLEYMKMIHAQEGIFLEPSACAGLQGLIGLHQTKAGQDYLKEKKIDPANVTHIIWATGGGLVPEEERQRLLKKTV